MIEHLGLDDRRIVLACTTSIKAALPAVRLVKVGSRETLVEHQPDESRIQVRISRSTGALASASASGS